MLQIKHLFVSAVLVLAGFICASAQSQRATVSGTVKDTTGEPVVGAVIIVPGTNNAAITDAEG